MAFSLAKVSLAELRTLQSKAEARADAARTRAVVQRFRAKQAQAQRQAGWVEQLQRLGADPDAPMEDRVSANVALSRALGVGRNAGEMSFSRLADHADRFALRRLGDRAYQRVWAELRPRVPEVFPAYLLDLEQPDEDDARALLPPVRDAVFTGKHIFPAFTHCGAAHRLRLDALWVPRRRQVDLLRSYRQDSRRCYSDADGFVSAMLDSAEAYLELREVDQAAAILKGLLHATTNERLLTDISKTLAQLTALKERLDRFPADSLEHELLRYHRGTLTDSELAQSEALLRSLVAQRVRRIREVEFVNRVPVFDFAWLKGGPVVVTGPRTGVDESNALRFYREPDRKGAPPEATVMILGGVPRQDVVVAARLDFRPAEDWAPRSRKPDGWKRVEARPSPALLVGLVDVSTPTQCEAVERDQVTARPLTGLGARIHGGKLEIVRVREPTAADAYCGDERFVGLEVVEVLASSPVPERLRYELQVRVRDTTLRATAGEVAVEATLREPPQGFVGLAVHGTGYVEFARPTLE